MTNPIGPLIPGDERLTHQVADTFAVVGTGDLSWTEKICAMAAARDGTLQLGFGLGKYTNRNVMDCYAGVSRGVQQITVRASRRLAPEPESTVVGPVRYEVVEPLRAIRFVLEPNDCQPISFDWLFESVVPPRLEDRVHMRGGYRVRSDLVRYHQMGVASGWVEVDGARTELTTDTWVSTRDHSWGVRYPTIGQPLTDVEPDRTLEGVRFQMIWCPITMERRDGSRYGLWMHYQIFDAPGFSQRKIEGFIEQPDGSTTADRRPRSRSDVRPRQPPAARRHDPRDHRGRRDPRLADRGGVRDRFPSRRRALLRLRRPLPR